MYIIMNLESGEAIKDVSCLTKIFCSLDSCKSYFNEVKKNIKELSKEIDGDIIETEYSITLDSEVLFKKVEINELKCINVISG